MKPLSCIRYIRGNPRNMLPLTLTTALAVALLYFLALLLGQLVGQMREMDTASHRNIAVLYGNAAGVPQDVLRGVLADDAVAAGYPAQVRSANFNLALGSPTTAYLFLVNNQALPPVLDAQGLTLTQGRLPQQPGEVALHRRLAANNGLSVGSVVPKDTANWRIDGDVTVVGLLDGPAIVGLGCTQGLSADTPGAALILAARPGSFDGMNRFLEERYGKEYRVRTLPMAMAETAKVTMAYSAITVVIGAVLVLVLGFLLGNISRIQYEQRRKEFQLLHAVGYTTGRLVGKVLQEISASGALGWALGILLAMLAGALANVMLFQERAMDLPLVQPVYLAALLLVPAFVTLFGINAPVRMIRMVDI